MKRAFNLVLAFLLCQGVGLIGALFTTPAIPTWYAWLQKPTFSPPNWLFGPVWFLLFTLMSISAYLIFEVGINKKKVRIALIFFIFQLVLNFLWSIIFFGLRLPQYAFLEIVVLWIFILLTILRFYRVSKTAGLLLLPYILWVSFAAILNFSIIVLNR